MSPPISHILGRRLESNLPALEATLRASHGRPFFKGKTPFTNQKIEKTSRRIIEDSLELAAEIFLTAKKRQLLRADASETISPEVARMFQEAIAEAVHETAQKQIDRVLRETLSHVPPGRFGPN